VLAQGLPPLGQAVGREGFTAQRVHHHLPLGQAQLDQEMPGKAHALCRQIDGRSQLQPDQRHTDGNAAPRLQHMVDVAVGRVVVIVEIAAKTQLAIEELVEHAQALQRIGFAGQALEQAHLQPVQLGAGRLQVEIGHGILGDADCRLHQRQVVIALHQRCKVLQGRWRVFVTPAHDALYIAAPKPAIMRVWAMPLSAAAVRAA